jgi:hypothetical protein
MVKVQNEKKTISPSTPLKGCSVNSSSEDDTVKPLQVVDFRGLKFTEATLLKYPT